MVGLPDLMFLDFDLDIRVLLNKRIVTLSDWETLVFRMCSAIKHMQAAGTYVCSDKMIVRSHSSSEY